MTEKDQTEIPFPKQYVFRDRDCPGCGLNHSAALFNATPGLTRAEIDCVRCGYVLVFEAEPTP